MNTKQFSVMQLIAAFILGAIISGLVVFANTEPEVVTETVIETQIVTVEKPVFYPHLVEIADIYKEENLIEIADIYEKDNFVEIADIYKEEKPEEVEEVQTSTSNTSLYSLTAYCPCEICCGEYANGITATGTIATANRTIAVDPNVIPYGTHVLINGHEYVAEDCGGAIQGNRIDVYFDTHQEALNFGRQTAEVTILN